MLRRFYSVLFEYSGFLILGAVLALIWANIDNASYESFVHFTPFGKHDAHSAAHEKPRPETEKTDTSIAKDEEKHETETAHKEPSGTLPKPKGEVHAKKHYNVHFVINEILMVLFFALAGKEVMEALLPGGALSSPKKAATPLLATLGGMVGPAGLYLGCVFLFKHFELVNGWAIPCATDIAFSYLVARMVFGAGHPAIPFLLLLAIADDAGGLIILATCYPSGPMHMELFFPMVVGAVALGLVFKKVFKFMSWIPYIAVPGVISWFGFLLGGIEPALGLLPIIPVIPHAHSDLGIFCIQELKRKDPLNRFEHDMKIPVELILGLFGLANAGVVLSEGIGPATGFVTFGLLVGKPVGILLLTLLAVKLLRFEMPEGMLCGYF